MEFTEFGPRYMRFDNARYARRSDLSLASKDLSTIPLLCLEVNHEIAIWQNCRKLARLRYCCFDSCLVTINSCCRLCQIRDTGNQCRSQLCNTTNGQDAVSK